MFKNSQKKHHIQVDTVFKSFILDRLKKSYMKLLIRFGPNIQNSIIRMILLTVISLYLIVKISLMVIVICGIRTTLYHPLKSLVLHLEG